MKLEPLQGGILLRCGVCLQGTSKGLFIGFQGRSCGECCAIGSATEGLTGPHVWPAGRVMGVNRPPCLRFFLTAIWRDIPTKDMT
jgi:hypothetical protein